MNPPAGETNDPSRETARDFFLSYAGQDRPWAEWIAQELERAGYKVELDVWDWPAGADFIRRMEQALQGASCMLAVISDAYFAPDSWANQERTAAFLQAKRHEGRLLPVLVRPCTIPALYGPLVFIDLVGLDRAAARSRLLRGVAPPSHPTTDVSFPPDQSSDVVTSRSNGPSTAMYPRPLPSIVEPSPSRAWTIPPPHPQFTGRNEELARLSELLGGPLPRAPVAITGLGGIGKSQLAQAYAITNRAQYRVGYWIRAENISAATIDLTIIARELDLVSVDEAEDAMVVSSTRRWLAQNSNWLLVLDNVEDASIVMTLIPDDRLGDVLITSRSPAWGRFASVLSIGVLPRTSSIAFLTRRAEDDDEEAAGQLAARLGDLPLALEQAGALMEQTGTSISEYIEILGDRSLSPVMKGLGSAEETVEATWVVNFAQVEQESVTAASLLRRCSFLDPDSIKSDLLIRLCRGATTEATENRLQMDESFLRDLRILRRYSLINRVGDIRTVHRLVQEATRQRMDIATQKGHLEAVMHELNEAFPQNIEEMRNWKRCEELLPHILTGARHVSEMQSDPHSALEVLERAARYCVLRRTYSTGMECAELAVSLSSTSSGQPSPSALITQGDALRGLGRYKEAMSAHQRALQMFESALGGHDMEVGSGHDAVAHDCYELGRYAEAIQHHEQALEIRRRYLGDDHLLVSYSLDGMGHPQRGLGRFADAHRNYARALRIRQATLGPNHPEVAETLDGIGHALRGMGDCKNAIASHISAKTICERSLAQDNPQLADTLNGLGYALQDAHQTEIAIETHQRSLTINESKFGPDHARVAVSLNGLGYSFRMAGRYEDARKAHQRAASIYKNDLGETHPRWAFSIDGVAHSLFGLAAFSEAAALHSSARSAYERSIGTSNLWIAWTSLGLAKAQRMLGQVNSAADILKEVLTMLIDTYGADNPWLDRFRADWQRTDAS